MKFAIPENKVVDFSLDSIFDLRESLTSIQRDILDNVWAYYLSTEKNYPIRSLPKIIGKQSVAETLKGIDRVFISEDYDQGFRVVKLNILGALLSVEGGDLASLLIRLLDFIRGQYGEDFHISNFTSEFLQQRLKLSDAEVVYLFRVINLYGLYALPFNRAGYSSPMEWSINISDEIVEFNGFDNSKAYLSTRLNEFYNQVINQSSTDVMSYFSKIPVEVLDYSSKPLFISLNRLKMIENIDSPNYDCTRLISLCKELNDCSSRNNTYAVAMLTRTILDHIPPIFGFKSFSEVASNYGGGGKSFKSSSERLDRQMRLVADKFLHMQIRSKEVKPDMHEVNFSQELESVLSEVCRLLK